MTKHKWYIKDNASEIARARYGSSLWGEDYSGYRIVEFVKVQKSAQHLVVSVCRDDGEFHEIGLDPDMIELRETKLTARELLEQFASSGARHTTEEWADLDKTRSVIIPPLHAQAILDATEG